MEVSIITTRETEIILSRKDIIEGINGNLGIGKVPNNAEVFVMVPGGGNYSNMKLDVGYDIMLEITFGSQCLTLSYDQIFLLILPDEKRLTELEKSGSLEVFVIIPGGADWSGMKLNLDEDIKLTIKFKETNKNNC